MEKMIKFLVNFYDNGIVKYEAGKAYPQSEETRLELAKGNAEEVDAPESEAADSPNADDVSSSGEAEPVRESKKRRKVADED